MRKVLVVVGALSMLAVGAVAQNTWARRWGASDTKTLPPGMTVQLASWKGNNLWILMRERTVGEAPKNWVYKEFSNWGIVEGTLVLVEQ